MMELAFLDLWYLSGVDDFSEKSWNDFNAIEE